MPRELDVRDEPGHEHDIGRASPEDLVGNIKTTAARILGCRRGSPAGSRETASSGSMRKSHDNTAKAAAACSRPAKIAEAQDRRSKHLS